MFADLHMFVQVEVDISMDTMSPNYCRSKGEQIALNVDGTTYDETTTYSAYVSFGFNRHTEALWHLSEFFILLILFRKMMDKQTFTSIQATTNTSRYAAGVFRKGLSPCSTCCLSDSI